MMASRVTLLLLVTGLFAGMWSGDRADERSARERLLAHRSASSAVAPPLSARPHQAAVRSVAQHRGERSLSSIPLPDGIATGTYLIVDGRGRTETRIVTAAAAFPTGPIEGHVAADQYTVRVGRDRWHFIRLDDSAESLATRRALSRSGSTSERAASRR